MALLTAVLFLPFLIFTLPAGVWIDRLARRPILVISDVVRAIALASVPLAYAFDALSMWQLYVVGFVVGIGTVFFDVSYQSYLPSLVRREQLVDGNSKLQLSMAASQTAGPGVAGVLIGLLTAPVAVLVDAISFALSALFLARIKTHEEPPVREERRALRVELLEGLRYLWADTRIRAIAFSTILFNFFSNITFSIFLVYAVRDLDLGAGAIGLLFALGNVGGLAAALLARRVSLRLGIGPSMALGAASSTALVLLPLAPTSNPIPFLLVAMLVMTFGVVLYNMTGDQLPARDHTRSDARSSQRLTAVSRLGRDPTGRARRGRARVHDRLASDALRRRDRHLVRGRPHPPFPAPDARAGSVPIPCERLSQQCARIAAPRQLRLLPEPCESGFHGGQSLRLAVEPLEPRQELGTPRGGVQILGERRHRAAVELELTARVAAGGQQQLRPPHRRTQIVLVERDAAARQEGERQLRLGLGVLECLEQLAHVTSAHGM